MHMKGGNAHSIDFKFLCIFLFMLAFRGVSSVLSTIFYGRLANILVKTLFLIRSIGMEPVIEFKSY